MWIVNQQKEREKIYIKGDIESNITNMMDLSNRVYALLAAVNRVAAGSVSGIDQRLFGDCQRALQELSTALQNLYLSREYAKQLDTKEWVDNE